MKLRQILARLGVLELRGAVDVAVERATHDSRQTGPGTLFAAISGTRVDGHRFIPSALRAGAPAVLLSRFPGVGDAGPSPWPDAVAGIRVADPRRALALASAALEGDPAAGMTVFAVTGTNGKTSTVAILAAILEAAGRRVGTLGTTGIAWDGALGSGSFPATHTTPEGPDLYRWLARMRDDGVDAVALELSSHALDQGRAAGLPLDIAAWSNLSRDHLDYHGDMASYEDAKARLFTEWLPQWGKQGARAVLNVDDPIVAGHAEDWSQVLAVSARWEAVSAGVRPVEVPRFDREGARARVQTPAGELQLRTRLLGEHNFANALLAGACALAAGVPGEAVEAGWAAAVGAPGRLERVDVGSSAPLVLVDYAHTDDALTRVLEILRPITSGRIVTVFGCGGDRDRGKRPLMAAAAAAGSDELVLTSDNPRSEDPEAILDAMEAGLPAQGPPWRRVTDRREAIAWGISAAGPDDVVLIAGKGHETTQEVQGRCLPFDDRAVAREVLETRA